MSGGSCPCVGNRVCPLLCPSPQLPDIYPTLCLEKLGVTRSTSTSVAITPGSGPMILWTPRPVPSRLGSPLSPGCQDFLVLWAHITPSLLAPHHSWGDKPLFPGPRSGWATNSCFSRIFPSSFSLCFPLLDLFSSVTSLLFFPSYSRSSLLWFLSLRLSSSSQQPHCDLPEAFVTWFLSFPIYRTGRAPPASRLLYILGLRWGAGSLLS